MFRTERGAGRVPCKLNNVTNEKHQSSKSEKTKDKEAVSRGSVNYPVYGKEFLKLSLSFNKVIYPVLANRVDTILLRV